jgi:hypothetical protein
VTRRPPVYPAHVAGRTAITAVHEDEAQALLGRLGDELYPGEVGAGCAKDADDFARWVYRLATRAPGDNTMPLAYEGRFMRIAVVLVANKYKLREKGVDPYRKQAKRLIYTDHYDAVYVMGRDDNMWAVKEIIERLAGDGLIANATCHEYRLRSDFKKRRLARERAVIGCVRNRRGAPVPADPEVDADTEMVVDRFVPEHQIAGEITVNRTSKPELTSQAVAGNDAPTVIEADNPS